jgi:hypothetical protein
MPTKFRLALLAAFVLASLGFSAYGAGLAAPSLGPWALINDRY